MLNRSSPTRRVAAGLLGLCSLASLLMLSACDKQAADRAGASGSVLAFLSPPTPAEAARWAIDPYDANKRMAGMNLLANAPFGGDPVYTKVYRMALGAPPAEAPDSDRGVRAVAARALSLHGQPSDVDLIVPLLANEDYRVRAEGARALQRLHHPNAIAPLIKATSIDREDSADVRAEAACALGQYAEPRVLQALLAALGDDSLLVNRNASKSLSTLTGQDLGDDGAAWLAWSDSTKSPFAGRREYVYPYFSRDKVWYEYIPLLPEPPNEQPGTPAGMAPLGGDAPKLAGASTPATATPAAVATPAAPATPATPEAAKPLAQTPPATQPAPSPSTPTAAAPSVKHVPAVEPAPAPPTAQPSEPAQQPTTPPKKPGVRAKPVPPSTPK